MEGKAATLTDALGYWLIRVPGYLKDDSISLDLGRGLRIDDFIELRF